MRRLIWLSDDRSEQIDCGVLPDGLSEHYYATIEVLTLRDLAKDLNPQIVAAGSLIWEPVWDDDYESDLEQRRWRQRH